MSYNRFDLTGQQYLNAVQLLENAHKIADLFEQQEAQRKINETRRVSAESIREEAHLRQEQQILDVNTMLAQGVFKGAKGDKGDKGDQGIQGIQGVPGMTSSEADLIRLQEQARVAAEITRTNTFNGWAGAEAARAQAEADRVLAELAREAVVAGYSDTLALKVPQTAATGAAVLPKGTTAQRPETPLAGHTRFNTDLGFGEQYNGSIWVPITASQMLGAAAVKAISYNAQSIAENITIAANQNASVVGPVTVEDGYVVSIEDGGRLVVL